MPMTLRVIQWATGNTGQRALREVIRDPSLELVGVRVYDGAKDGVDAGALCGEAPTGMPSSSWTPTAACTWPAPRAPARRVPG
jgi:hypothetical protein